MVVRVDQPGDDEAALGIKRLVGLRLELRSDLDDRAVANEDVARRDLPTIVVHRHDEVRVPHH